MISLVLIVMIFLSCDDSISIQSPDNMTGEVIEKKFLALGDSYTIGQSVPEEYRWPNLLRDSLEMRNIVFNEPQIIAQTGWRTDQLMVAASAEAKDTDYGLVSLLIGVNNQYQGRSVDDFVIDFEALVLFAIERAGGIKDHVFVVSIPDYGCTPFGASNANQIAAEIDEFNSKSKEVTDRMGIRYINITEISREAKNDPSLIASDNLHPSAQQYLRWVEEILKSSQFLSDIKR